MVTQHRFLIYSIVIILFISGKNSKQKTVNATKVECGDQEMCQEEGGMSLVNTQCSAGSRQPTSMAHAARPWRKKPFYPHCLASLVSFYLAILLFPGITTPNSGVSPPTTLKCIS